MQYAEVGMISSELHRSFACRRSLSLAPDSAQDDKNLDVGGNSRLLHRNRN
jgi:hypothetical protein